jgi:hypothetical protein
MAEWQEAHGNQDKAAASREERRSQCAAPRPAPNAASAGAGAGGDARGG